MIILQYIYIYMISVVACAAEGSEIRVGVAGRHCVKLFTYLIMQLFIHSIIRSCSHTRSYVSVMMVERLGRVWLKGIAEGSGREWLGGIVGIYSAEYRVFYRALLQKRLVILECGWKALHRDQGGSGWEASQESILQNTLSSIRLFCKRNS